MDKKIKKNNIIMDYVSYSLLIITMIIMVFLSIASVDKRNIQNKTIHSQENHKEEMVKDSQVIIRYNTGTVESKPIEKNEYKKDDSSQSIPNKEIDSQPISDMPIAYYNSLSENDMMMMCTIVSSEAGYCEDHVQKAIAHTIINRLQSNKFPDTMYEVTTQENQYTAIHSYFDGQYRAGLYPGSDLWNHSMQLCYEAFNEWDFTGGAVAYYNPYMIGYNSYFESLEFTYENEYARFFKI